MGKLEHEGAFLPASTSPKEQLSVPGSTALEGGSRRRFIPMNFVTVATPHLGTWKPPEGWIARTFNSLVPVMASWTGHQLMYKVG